MFSLIAFFQDKTIQGEDSAIRQPYIKRHLDVLKRKVNADASYKVRGLVDASTAIDNALKIDQRIERDKKWQNSPFACFSVDAMSSVKYVPGKLPAKLNLSDKVDIIAAKGEYEPASFIIYPFENIENLRFEVTSLNGKEGSISAKDVDIKVVKCWYQGGTAWHSYFADRERRTLIPELLLNDESLIKVDYKTQENYLRVDYPSGKEYQWISYPTEAKGVLNVFNHAKEPVKDSKVLCPIKLTAGLSKQIWLTVNISKKTPAGKYTGEIKLIAENNLLGTLKINICVLPFILPEPKTYYDIEKDFYTIIYNNTNFSAYSEFLGSDTKSAEAQILKEFKNLHTHNLESPMLIRASRVDQALFKKKLLLMKKAGLNNDTIIGALTVFQWDLLFRYLLKGNVIPEPRWDEFVKMTKREINLVKEVLGHKNIYAVGWDEPGKKTLEAEQKLFELLHDNGIKILTLVMQVLTRMLQITQAKSVVNQHVNGTLWMQRSSVMLPHTQVRKTLLSSE
jgi:hypothetical protein